MADSNTIRILSLDGGGERGYLSLKFLQQFISLWGINPSALASYFDVICGTSIGGIMSLAFASGKTPSEIESFFLDTGPNIFTLGGSWTGTPIPPCYSVTPGVVPTATQQGELMVLDIPFYHSSYNGFPCYDLSAQYGTGLLAATLQSFFGTNTLANLQTNVLIPSYQTDTGTFVSFSNVNNSRFIGQNELISNVALATSAAPVYLASDTCPISFGEPQHQYSDGGVYLNNPALMGLALGKMVKPNANRYCVLSLGTGLVPGEGSYSYSYSNLFQNLIKNNTKTTPVNPLVTLQKLVSQAGAGSEESVAETLLLISQYTLDQLYYYRYQPIFNNLPEGQLPTLDNTSSIILDYYATKASDWYTNDLANIITFLGHLTA